MKSVSPTMLDLLKQKQVFKVDLYTFELANGGGTLRYCDGNADIVANGIRYPAGGTSGSNTAVGGPYFGIETNRFKMHQKISLSVDTLQFDVIPGAATIRNQPFLVACKLGVFGGAIMTVERCFMPTYGDTRAGTIVAFKGKVGGVQIGRSIATFTINSFLEVLNADLPRNVYQVPCVNTLGGNTCQVNLPAYTASFTDQGGSSLHQVVVGLGNLTAGYYDQGRITFTSGALSGLSRTIASSVIASTMTLTIVGILPGIPQAGDTMNISPGCDKSTGQNGCAKFGNIARFRGFRWIPNPATAF